MSSLILYLILKPGFLKPSLGWSPSSITKLVIRTTKEWSQFVGRQSKTNKQMDWHQGNRQKRKQQQRNGHWNLKGILIPTLLLFPQKLFHQGGLTPLNLRCVRYKSGLAEGCIQENIGDHVRIYRIEISPTISGKTPQAIKNKCTKLTYLHPELTLIPLYNWNSW